MSSNTPVEPESSKNILGSAASRSAAEAQSCAEKGEGEAHAEGAETRREVPPGSLQILRGVSETDFQTGNARIDRLISNERFELPASAVLLCQEWDHDGGLHLIYRMDLVAQHNDLPDGGFEQLFLHVTLDRKGHRVLRGMYGDQDKAVFEWSAFHLRCLNGMASVSDQGAVNNDQDASRRGAAAQRGAENRSKGEAHAEIRTEGMSTGQMVSRLIRLADRLKDEICPEWAVFNREVADRLELLERENRELREEIESSREICLRVHGDPSDLDPIQVDNDRDGGHWDQ